MTIAEPYLSLYYTGAGSELRLDSGTDDIKLHNLMAGVARLNPSWHSFDRYDLAEVDMTLRINAATMAEVWTAYTALATYEKYVEAWSRRVTDYYVTIRYKPNGSTLSVAYMEATVESMQVDEPDGTGWVNDRKTLYDLHVKIWRRGLWLGDTETPTVTASADMPVVQSITFASAPATPGLVDLEFSSTLDSLGNLPNGWLLVAPSSSYVEVQQTNGMTATGWTSVADTAAKAWGNILRYTPAGTSESFSGSLTLTNTYSTTAHFYAAIRNNSTKNWRLRLRSIHTSGVTGWSYSPYMVIGSADAANPTMYYLGSITAARGIKYLQIGATLLDASVSGSLDVDYISVLAQLPNSYAMQFDAESMTGVGYSYTALASAPLGRAPYFYYRDTTPAPDIDVPLLGSQAQRVYMTGSTMSALFMATASTYWRLVDSGGTVRQIYLDATRRLGHVVPQ